MKKYDASSFPKSDAHLEKAHSLIPAGAHTYSKGDDCFPEHGPHYLVRGKGCRCGIWMVTNLSTWAWGLPLRGLDMLMSP